MAPKQSKEGRTLDAIVDLVATDGLPSVDDAREELRAAGLDADTLGRTIRERIVGAVWKERAQARRAAFEARDRHRPPRPLDITREALMARARRVQGAAVAFRNADQMSEGDLWDLICDLETEHGD